MTKNLLLSILLFGTWATFARWQYVCKIKHHCEGAPVDTTAAATAAERSRGLVLKDRDSLVLTNYEHFAFAAKAVRPDLSDDNKKFVDKTAAYLKSHPDRTLNITGFFRNSEKDLKSGFFENLGLARASEVRALLVARGIDEKRINIDYGAIKTDDLNAPVSFNILRPATTKAEEVPASKGAAFTFTNMTFSDANFESGSDVFRPGPQFQAYADSVVTYLKLNQGKKLAITGHTDNVGEDAYNDALGLRRSKSVRQYFLGKGVKAPIMTNSKGEKEPIATNETDEGRAKNRRVNVAIQ